MCRDSSGILSLAATRNFKWVYTGSEDGIIRKYDFFASMNGEYMLQANQRYGFMDTVTKVGISDPPIVFHVRSLHILF